MQKTKIKPCPFCGKKLERNINIFVHPSNDCILSQKGFTEDHINNWNIRKPIESILIELEACEKECARADSDKAPWMRAAYIAAIKIVKRSDKG